MDKQRTRRLLVRRAIAGLAVAGAVTTGAVTVASPAQAWPGDAGVTVDGFASCNTGVTGPSLPANDVWMYLDATGEIEQAGVNYWTRYFEARFGNVPSSGSEADVWVYCAVPGEPSGWRYAGETWVSRPWITTTSLPIWATA